MLRLVLLDSSLQSPGQEKHFGILFTPFRNIVHEIVVCTDMVEEIMAGLARFSALFIVLCSPPGILRHPPFFAREREKHCGTFSVHVRLVVLELAPLEKKKEEIEEEDERK